MLQYMISNTLRNHLPLPWLQVPPACCLHVTPTTRAVMERAGTAAMRSVTTTTTVLTGQMRETASTTSSVSIYTHTKHIQLKHKPIYSFLHFFHYPRLPVWIALALEMDKNLPEKTLIVVFGIVF